MKRPPCSLTSGVPPWDLLCWRQCLGFSSVPACRRYLIGRSLRHRRLLLARDTVYDWNTSHSTIQLGSIGIGRTTVTSQAGVIEGIPPPQVSQNVEGFWKHLTPSYIASGFSTATTLLKRSRGSWVELFAWGWASWGKNTGAVGVITGMGTTVRILCNVSHLCPNLPPHLTVAPDMWNKHRGGHLRRSSFGSSDCVDGGSLDTKQRDAAIHTFAIASSYEAFAFTTYSLLAGLHRRDMLKQKAIHACQRQLCKPNLLLAIVSMVA